MLKQFSLLLICCIYQVSTADLLLNTGDDSKHVFKRVGPRPAYQDAAQPLQPPDQQAPVQQAMQRIRPYTPRILESQLLDSQSFTFGSAGPPAGSAAGLLYTQSLPDFEQIPQSQPQAGQIQPQASGSQPQGSYTDPQAGSRRPFPRPGSDAQLLQNLPSGTRLRQTSSEADLQLQRLQLAVGSTMRQQVVSSLGNQLPQLTAGRPPPMDLEAQAGPEGEHIGCMMKLAHTCAQYGRKCDHCIETSPGCRSALACLSVAGVTLGAAALAHSH